MKVAVIGHRELVLSEKIIELVKTQIARLIAEGADTFYFAEKSPQRHGYCSALRKTQT